MRYYYWARYTRSKRWFVVQIETLSDIDGDPCILRVVRDQEYRIPVRDVVIGRSIDGPGGLGDGGGQNEHYAQMASEG
jgi:hypothetical protein